ncbi:MAG TPA: hypothetical protein VK015_06445 [Microbacterium sp.]|nr:hypothetical protein [Microbacterium sp.]
MAENTTDEAQPSLLAALAAEFLGTLLLVLGGAEPLAQLWVFLVSPIVGALIAGVLHRVVFDRRDS